MNRKSLNFFVLMFMSITLASCVDIKRDTNLPSYVNIATKKHLRGDTVLDNAMSQMTNPSQNWIVGDSMVFIDIDDEYVLSLVSISGDSIVDRLVARGEGPGQLLRPSILQLDSDGNIYLFDDIRKTLYSKPTFKEFSNGIDSIGALHFKEITGSYLSRTAMGYVGDNLYGDGNMFTFFDSDGNVKIRFGLVPGTKTSEHVNPDFYMAYQVAFVVSPDKKYLCAAGSYHDWLAFFDVSGDTPKLIKEHFTSPPIVNTTGKGEQFHLERLPETMKYYFTIAPYNGGVFLNYVGTSYENIKEGNVVNYILQYGWDGELKEVFMPEENIYELAATSDGRHLYATFMSDDGSETKLIRYDINN